MRYLPILVVLALCGFAPGCGSGGDGMGDDDASMREDAASGDGSVGDGGSDAGDDLGTEDAGAEDAGTQDLGTEDAGAEDASTQDLGTQDACDTDNGGCDPHRPCEDVGGEPVCGACDEGYTDDGMGGCEQLACMPSTEDEYEPDAADSPLVVQLSGETILERSFTSDDVDAFSMHLPGGCGVVVSWSHDGQGEGPATYAVYVPTFGPDPLVTGAFPSEGSIPISTPTDDLDFILVVEANGLCASYTLSAIVGCD